jgi:hypothetical protein
MEEELLTIMLSVSVIYCIFYVLTNIMLITVKTRCKEQRFYSMFQKRKSVTISGEVMYI